MHSIPAEFLGSTNSAATFHWPVALSAVNLESLGLFVLAGALVYLWLTVRQLRAVVGTMGKRLAAPAPAPVPVPSPEAPVPAPAVARTETPPEAIDEGVLVAIAAAVAMVLKHPHHIVAVQQDVGTQIAWSAEGRRELYHSHRVR